MGKNRLLVGLILVAAFAVGVMVASPWWSLSGLAQAINAGDRQRLVRYVDFPRLRESISGQLTAKLGQQLGEDVDGNSSKAMMALAGTALGSAVIDKVVDSLVTPEGVAAILEGREQIQFDPEHPPTRLKLIRRLHERAHLDWIDIGSIRATVYDSDSKVLTHALLERDGLTWRVVDVDIPDLEP